jgi:AcrR family transcriptional regulator
LSQRDWLVGSDRRREAADRIHAAAAELIAARGFKALTIDALAAEVHCSPATIYRNAGGKTAILEAVLAQMSARIVKQVTAAITNLHGAERIVTAVVVALELIRAEPLGASMMGAIRPGVDSEWLTGSPMVVELAEQMIGHHDPAAAQWLIRATFALWYWPVMDREREREIVARFIGPPFAD